MISKNQFTDHTVEKLTSKYETQLAVQDDKNNANKINDKRNAKKVKKHMTKNAMERLVEDLISESMAKGKKESHIYLLILIFFFQF